MLVMSLVVLGLFSFRDLGVDLFPKADPATVNVSLRLPGAAPDEMTSSVIMPMENALSGIAGIDQLRANVNAGGNASITVQFLLGRDLDDAANTVREKVAGAMRNVPPEVLPPVIQKQDPDADPIMSLVVSGKSTSLRALTEIADKQVKRALESVDGVGAVTISGDRPREIHIVVDVEKLNAHGLSIDQVRDAIQKENVEIPGGTLEQGKWEVGLRTLGRIDASEQFNDIIIATVNGVPLRVSDIGYAEDTVQKVATSLFMQDGAPAVQLDIRRASGENTIKVTEAVKAEARVGPSDAAARRHADDEHATIRGSSTRRSRRSKNICCGAACSRRWSCMFFIRNLRAVIISALAIPASIIATFTLMRAMDFTLNNMTLLALTLAVGIVIDDAIVVLENIFRYIEEKHRTPFDAAIEGTREVALPVMATTLSLIVIFLPVAFMTGYARRFIYPFGWTMAFAILVSMIVSFTLTPMLSSRWLKISNTRRRAATRSTTGCSMRWIGGTPRRCDGRSRIRWRSSACRPRLVVLTYPAEPDGRAHVRAQRGHGRIHRSRRHAAGTSIEGTTEIARSMVREIGEQEGVSHVTYLAGADRYTHFHLYFYLLPVERADRHAGAGDRARRGRSWRSTRPTARRCRRETRSAAGGNTAIQAVLLGPGSSASSTSIRSRFSRRRRRRRASSTRGPTTAMPVPRFRSPWIVRAPPTWACAWRPSATPCA